MPFDHSVPGEEGSARRDGTCYPTFSATRSCHRIFSEQATVGSWLAAEQALAVAQAHHGVISGGEADSIVGLDAAATIQLEDMWRQTRNVGYPILPLVRMMAAALPPGADGRAHYWRDHARHHGHRPGAPASRRARTAEPARGQFR